MNLYSYDLHLCLCFFVQRNSLPNDFWCCHLCVIPRGHQGRYTRSGLRRHLLREHTSGLTKTRLLNGFWRHDIVELSGPELQHQWDRLHIKYGSKNVRQEIYTNLHVRAAFNRISSAQEGEGREIDGIIPSNNAVAPSTGTYADTATREYHNNLPVGYYDVETSSTEQVDLIGMQSPSPENWETEFDLGFMPDLNSDASNALIGSGNGNYSQGLNGDFLVNEVADSLRTEVNDMPVVPLISPPDEFADRDNAKDIGGQSVSSDPDLQFGCSSSQDEVDVGRQRDTILQIVAERNAFRRDSDLAIADRISARVNSGMSSVDIRNILFAINIHEKMFIERINDLLEAALSAESSGQLGIAMLIQELRSRASNIQK